MGAVRGEAGDRGSSRPLAEAPDDVALWDRGVDGAFVERLRNEPGGDVWIVGGGKLQSGFFALDAIDRTETAIVPVLLGDGVRMFPPALPTERWLELADVRRFPLGGVILDYRRAG